MPSNLSLMPGAVANILDTVGGTPIVKLNSLGAHTKAEIYVKCEFMNPGGSMKDRIALQIVNDAEKRGELKPGGTIVEATSGNTGMGLALVAATRGYKAIFVMPDKMSDEKIKSLRAVGAKVVITPTNVEADDPRSYYCVSRRIADETPNAFYANQYHNPSNPQAHYNSTGPEIWEQTGGGQFDVLVGGMGTGGTLSGTGRYLKEKKPEIKIVGADPVGSLYYDYFKTGQLTTPHPYKVEGIGEDFLPSNMDIKILDEVIRLTDKECFMVARALVREEGILCGGSGGASVAAAIKYAEMIDKPIRIIAHLPDSAMRYLTKHLDDEWMRENGFMGPQPTAGKVSDLLAARGNVATHVAQFDDSARDVVAQMKEHGISQLPVMKEGKLLGVISEKNLLSHLLLEEAGLNTAVSKLADTNFTSIDPATPTSSLFLLFNQTPVIMVLQDGELLSVITKIDLIDFMADKLA